MGNNNNNNTYLTGPSLEGKKETGGNCLCVWCRLSIITKSISGFLQRDFVKSHSKLWFPSSQGGGLGRECGGPHPGHLGLPMAPSGANATVVLFFRTDMFGYKLPKSWSSWENIVAIHFSPHHVQFKYPQSSFPASLLTPCQKIPTGFPVSYWASDCTT